MRLSYFLRGVGIGVVITTIILSISHCSNRKMTDAEIIEQARKLGMTFGTVEPTSSESTLMEPTVMSTDDTQPTEPVTEPTQPTEPSTETTQPTEPSTEPTQPTEPVTEPTQPTVPVTEPTQSTEKATQADETKEYTIEIKPGMSSNQVSRLLADNGIVANEYEFDDFLVDNGYENLIRIGIFKVNSNMTYKQIADVISGR